MPRLAQMALWAAALTIPNAASAELSDAANRNAYTYVVRCFAVAPLAKQRGISTDRGARAYVMAQSLGSNLGYSVQQTDSDLRQRAKTELSLMLRDAAYLNRVLSDCTKLNLLR